MFGFGYFGLHLVSLGTNIKRLRTVAGFRQAELAHLVGISPSQLSEWETDRYVFPRISSLVRLAKTLHCSVEDLLAGVDPDYDRIRRSGGAVVLSDAASSAIAVVAEGDALSDGITWNERERERPKVLRRVPRPGGLGDPRAYGIEIRGDSMVPAYRPNMIAIVSPALAVRDGDEVYAHLASGERLVRLLYMPGRGYLLQPYNPAHRVLVARRRDIRAMHAIAYSVMGSSRAFGPDADAGDRDVG